MRAKVIYLLMVEKYLQFEVCHKKELKLVRCIMNTRCSSNEHCPTLSLSLTLCVALPIPYLHTAICIMVESVCKTNYYFIKIFASFSWTGRKNGYKPVRTMHTVCKALLLRPATDSLADNTARSRRRKKKQPTKYPRPFCLSKMIILLKER